MSSNEKINYFVNVNDYKTKFDTFDLNIDECSKKYWKNQFIYNLINKFAEQAKNNEDNGDNKNERVMKYQKDYKDEVIRLMEENNNDPLSVRQLLQLNEILLKKYDFKDIWRKQKQEENFQAIQHLSQHLHTIDAIENNKDRWVELFFGVFAGNIFDYGASAVQEIIQNSKDQEREFGMKEALTKVQKRPWLHDNFDAFISRIEKEKFNCCAFFCDNAGVDFVLGVLPFIREFLKMGTKIILCANSHPSLNDITFDELGDVLREARKQCDILNKSMINGELLLSKTGSSSCCLNFLEIDDDLLDLMLKMGVDLIAIEGMGRAIHTNFLATFKIECLKLAVIKNLFLAKKLGGEIFDVICKYEHYPDV